MDNSDAVLDVGQDTQGIDQVVMTALGKGPDALDYLFTGKISSRG
jgi:hypothetical protein